MVDDSLQCAIRALKLEDPALTVKGIHAALEARGERIELSAIKKAAGKVTKALAQEAKLNPPLPLKEVEGTSPTARKQENTVPSARTQRARTQRAELGPLPTLVAARGAINFVCCHTCHEPVANPRVCGQCRAVCYCSERCQTEDFESHHSDCANLAAHVVADFRVRMLPEPDWLGKAQDHRCDMSWCELLRRLGCHDLECYKLLCGCCLPSRTHRYVISSLPNGEVLKSGPGEAVHVQSWSHYYEHRKSQLPRESPLALLLTWPMTVYYALLRLGLTERTTEVLNI